MPQMCRAIARYNLKTGELISRKIYEYYDVSDEEYAELCCIALTGMRTREVARRIAEEVEEEAREAII